MKTVVIKFKKSRKPLNKVPNDTRYRVVRSCFLLNITIDLAHKYEGLVCSFRDKNPTDTLRCKLVVQLPKENVDAFVTEFIKEFNKYIENVSWR